MASKALRRKPRSTDIDKPSEKHMETGDHNNAGPHDPASSRKCSCCRQIQDFWDRARRGCLRWKHLLSTFIAQSARKIGNVLSGFGSKLKLARLFGCCTALQSSQNGQTVPVNLNLLQEERLRLLRERLHVPYDCSSAKHQDALKELWRLAYPDRQLPPLKSDIWKEMGWQNNDPATDFRAGGFISLENLIYFARNYPDSFHRLLHKEDGKRAEWEYPFVVAGVNISYMLVQMLDLESENIRTKAGIHFVQLLGDEDTAFEDLFCVTFQMLDAQWLARRASYMEFNEVLKFTRAQLEQELTIKGIANVKNMPSFSLLKR
ncbi:hypothetical protein ACP4OV_014471 [Aristida adscensionis]